jgi:hypothetical protein
MQLPTLQKPDAMVTQDRSDNFMIINEAVNIIPEGLQGPLRHLGEGTSPSQMTWPTYSCTSTVQPRRVIGTRAMLINI